MLFRSVSAAVALATIVTAQNDTKYFITFGDSYSQTGFDINGDKPSAANPLGNPALPGWTASGGLDWIGFMVTEFNTSLTLSYNFAYGGATVDADIVAPYAEDVLSFIDQVQEFSDSIASKPDYAPWTADNTVVGAWFGVNDIAGSYWSDTASDTYAAIAAKYFEELQILYDAGVRQFVLLGVPPIQKTPSIISQGEDAVALLAAGIDEFNGIIESSLADFTAANTGVTAKVIDTAVAFNTAIDDPTSYGSPDATCYNADGVSCLWFNDFHPAIAIQRLVASEVAAEWDSGFFECVDSVLC